MGDRLFRLKEPVWESTHDYLFEGIKYRGWRWGSSLAEYTITYQSEKNWMGSNWTISAYLDERNELHERCASLEDGQKWCLEDFLGRITNDFEEVECE